MRLNSKRSSVRCSSELFESLEPRQVLAAATTTSLTLSTNNSVLGQSVVLTATVASPTPGTPTGVVNFRDASGFLASVPVDTSGHATFTSYNLFKGDHPIYARYVGDKNYKASISATQDLTVTRGGGYTVAPNGLRSVTTQAGSGTAVVNSRFLQINYTGYLGNGFKFDSSLLPKRTPFTFQLGMNEVIAGWDQGILGMKAGETRVLIIPPDLAYGSGGNGNVPPNAQLFFIVQLISFVGTPTTPTVLATGANFKPILSGQAASTEVGTDFGAVLKGSSSSVLKILLSRGTTANIQFTHTPPLTVTGANPGRFTVSQPFQDSDGNEAITVQYNAAALGSKRAMITIFTNDTTNPMFVIKLNGTSV